MANFYLLVILSLVLFISIAGATQFKVGGSKGWSVPNDPKEYSQWAQKNRFRVGDSLLFVYLPDVDSVLLVNDTSYHNCDTSSPIDTLDDGNTVFVFTHPGPYQFISGNRDNCLKNESLHVVVMADHNNKGNPAPSPSSSSNSPTVNVIPSSFPNGEGSNSSPPPPKGAASTSKVVSLLGSLGALIASILFVL